MEIIVNWYRRRRLKKIYRDIIRSVKKIFQGYDVAISFSESTDGDKTYCRGLYSGCFIEVALRKNVIEWSIGISNANYTSFFLYDIEIINKMIVDKIVAKYPYPDTIHSYIATRKDINDVYIAHNLFIKFMLLVDIFRSTLTIRDDTIKKMKDNIRELIKGFQKEVEAYEFNDINFI
jgi:hypothetical protein